MGILSSYGVWNSGPKFVSTFQLHSVYYGYVRDRIWKRLCLLLILFGEPLDIPMWRRVRIPPLGFEVSIG
jgi:hypothetical protein